MLQNRIASSTALAGAFAALLTLAPCAARADLTVVSETTVGGIPAAATAATKMPDMSKPLISTAYYKADKVRTENGDTVTLFTGGADGKLVTLNPANKTYFVLTNPYAALLSFTATGKATKTDEKKTLLGKDATKSGIDVTLKMGMSGSDPSDDGLMKVAVLGDEWTADVAGAPSSASGLTTGFLGTMMKGAFSSGVKELTKSLGEIQGFPLLTTLSFNFSYPPGSPIPAMTNNAIPSKITVRTEVKSVMDTPLADDLFVVPADYKLVDAPPMALPGGDSGASAPAAPPADAAAPAK